MSELQGVEEALKMFKDFPDKVKLSVDRKAMNEASALVAEAAKENLTAVGGIDTGELLESVRASRVRTYARKGTLLSKVSAAFYGKFLEWGFMHTGGKHIAARPWMARALMENEQKVLDTVGRVIKEATDTVAREGFEALKRRGRRK